MHVIGAAGLSRDEIARGQLRKGEGIVGKIIKTGVPIVLHDIADEPHVLNRTGSRDLSSGQRIAFIGTPIKAVGETISVLSADRDMTTYHGYLEHDVRLIKMVANLVGQAIKLHQLVAAEREQRMMEQHRLQKAAAPVRGLVNVIGESERMQQCSPKWKGRRSNPRCCCAGKPVPARR